MDTYIQKNYIYTYVYICLWISMYKKIIYISWSTVVKGAPKASFSISTTLRGRGGCYSFP